jgi:predicted Zn-dependent protease
LIDQLQKIKGNEDILIGFTEKLKSRHKEAFGHYAVGCILIGACETSYSKVILHEIGHHFGAEHTDDQKSIMYSKRLKDSSYDFDEENKKIILKNLSFLEAPEWA